MAEADDCNSLPCAEVLVKSAELRIRLESVEEFVKPVGFSNLDRSKAHRSPIPAAGLNNRLRRHNPRKSRTHERPGFQRFNRKYGGRILRIRLVRAAHQKASSECRC